MQLYTPTWKQQRNQCLDKKGNISDEFRERSKGVYGWYNNSLALILLTTCLEKPKQFDIHRSGSHTAGLCAKSSDTARISLEVKFDCNSH